MKQSLKFVIAVLLSISGVVAQAEDTHAEHHPAAASTSASKTMVDSKEQQELQAQMVKMKALKTKMAEAKTPEERQAVMQESMGTMKEGMAMMKQMHMSHCQNNASQMDMIDMMSIMMEQQSSMMGMPKN